MLQNNPLKKVFVMSKLGSSTATTLDGNMDGEIKQPAETAERLDEPSLSSSAVAFILFGLSLPVFLIALDTSIVATVRTSIVNASDSRVWLTSLCFLLRPFHTSPIDSSPRRISGGMGARIFLHCSFL